MSNESISLPEDFDTEAHASSIDRSLGIERKEEAVAMKQVISQVFPTEAEDLWDALTNAERLPRWFSPVSGELELGGRYHIEGNASGTVTSCDPPHSFSATWEFGGEASDISVEVEPAEGGARFTLTHRGDVKNDFWHQFGPGATGVGWDLSFLGLHLYLEYQSDLPLESEKWIVTEEYREFVGLVSTRWAEAAVTAGVPDDEARGAEERTTAFYRGDTDMGNNS